MGFVKREEEDFLIFFFHGLLDVPYLRGDHVGEEDTHQTAQQVSPEHLDAVRAMREEGGERADQVGEHSAEEVAVEGDGGELEHVVDLLCSFDVFIINDDRRKVKHFLQILFFIFFQKRVDICRPL